LKLSSFHLKNIFFFFFFPSLYFLLSSFFFFSHTQPDHNNAPEK